MYTHTHHKCVFEWEIKPKYTIIKQKKTAEFILLQSETQDLVFFSLFFCFQIIKTHFMAFLSAGFMLYPPSNLRAAATPCHSGIKAQWAFRGEGPSRWQASLVQRERKEIHPHITLAPVFHGFIHQDVGYDFTTRSVA